MTNKHTYEELENCIRTLEEKIASKDSILETVFEMSPFSMWISDNIGIVRQTNRSLRETIGLNNEEIVGKYNILKDKNLEISGDMPKVKNVFKNHEPAKFNLFWKADLAGDVNFDGARDIYIDVFMYPILDENDQLKNVVCQWVDISELKLAEMAIKKSEENYRLAMEATTVGLWDWNIETGDVFYSSNWAKIVLENVVEPEYQTWESRIHPDDKSEVLSSLQTHLNGDLPKWQMEHRLQTKQGDWRWVLGRGRVVEKTSTGQPLRMIGTMTDITEQKRIEETLKKSEKKYRRLLESLERDYIIYSHDKDGNFTYLSPSVFNVLGYSRDEFMGHYAEYQTDSPINKDAAEHTNAGLRGEQQEPYEAEFWHKNGGRVILRTTEVPVLDDKGNVLGIDGIVQDITELKKAEELLIKNESLFRGLYDNMTSGSAIYEVINDGSKGSDYIIKSFNKKSLEIEGKTLDQVVGKSLVDLRPNIDDYGLIPVMKKVWETGVPDYFPIKIYQDKIFSNYYENYIFKIPTGEVVTIYNDVTDKKNSEIALKESEKRFALAMEFANDGIFDWNLETNEIYYSPGWKRMLGYGDDELPNDFTVWESLTAPEDVKRSWKMQNELINKKRDRFEMEFKMKHKDGHWVDILSRANAIFDESNKAVRIIGTHVDISERKNLENQLLKSQKLESIGNLAGGIAHEFNNILSIIIGNNELIMEDLPEWSLSRESCEEIRIAGLRARDIVKHLLTFSRQDDSTKKPTNMISVVTESLKLIRSTTPTNIEIKDKISPNCLPILGDATQINQILINLCSNAIDALPISGGIIDIELRNSEVDQHNGVSAHKLAKGKYIKLMVRDNGSGIPQKILDRIFEPYFTTKDVGKGSGIGLAVVHGIIENHGGLITCESTKGEGTTFTILLPAYEGLVEEEREQKNALPGKGERVLYVDDEPSIAKLGKRHLESLGYDAYSTTDPKKALEMIKAEPDRFDLVISDMAMPNMPGDQLIEEILSVNYKMPTMVCSGYSSRMSETKALEMGIKAFVMKPLNKNELAKKVRDVLDNSSKKIVN